MANTEGSLESAARFTRGGIEPAPDHDATERDRLARIRTEQSRLIQWAEASSKIGVHLPPEDTSGGEHQIYYSANRYLKATIPQKHKGYGIALGSFSHGATPSEYLDRLHLQNCIFNDDIRLEYIIPNAGFPIIVT